MGYRPKASSMRDSPKDHISAAMVYGKPFKRSGDIYDLLPMNELAMESISCPLTPKSHSFTSPRELTRIFDGFISAKKLRYHVQCQT